MDFGDYSDQRAPDRIIARGERKLVLARVNVMSANVGRMTFFIATWLQV